MSNTRFPSRVGGKANLLERVPLWALQPIAARQARITPLGRQPGWRFDLPELDLSPDTTFRRELWSAFRDDGVRRTITVRWYDGLKVRLYLGNDLSYCLFVGGSYEPNEFAFLAAVLRPGMTVVDGGANDGLYSLFASSRVGHEGRVIAFEPSERELDRLRANIRLNRLDNVEVRAAALGSSPGNAELAIAVAGHEGQNTIGARVSNQNVPTRSRENVVVETIDSLTEQYRLERLDVVKLDVEGCELQVIDGARAALARFKPLLLVEVEPERLASHGVSRGELLETIGSLDYRLFVFDEQTAQLRPPRSPAEACGNVIAAPPSWEPPAL